MPYFTTVSFPHNQILSAIEWRINEMTFQIKQLTKK
jgi:hypothetical protein